MKRKITLAQAFSDCAKQLKGSALSECSMKKAEKDTALIRKMLNLTTIQGCLLSIIMSNEYFSMTIWNFAEYLGMNVVDIVGLHREFEYMADKGIITIEGRIPQGDWNESYHPTMKMFTAVKRNSGIEVVDYSSYNENMFWTEAKSVWSARKDSVIMYEEFKRYMVEMINGCINVEVCRRIAEMQLGNDEVTLLVVAILFAQKDINTIEDSVLNDTFPSKVTENLLLEIHHGRGDLAERHLLECDRFECGYNLSMSRLAKRMLMGIVVPRVVELDCAEEKEERPKEKDVAIKKKEMFYNATEEKEIERLKKMLGIDNYREIVRRMEDEGMNTGLTCLLFGAPGTGKTETVKQIARETGRRIIQVDMSSLKSKWNGETEKNVNQVFVDYKNALESDEVEPILLFNEADAIFSKRIKHVSSNNEQHGNSVQNILLENMDTFSGIMIATTNMTENFDKAFERRFLYKICFSKPNAEVRAKIWKSRMPKLTDEEVTKLGGLYELSGAQIDNVVRKVIVEKILFGEQIDLDKINNLCKQEKM